FRAEDGIRYLIVTGVQTCALPILPSDRKIGGPQIAAIKAHRVKSHLVDIPVGTTILGLERVQGDEFGWDNEFGAHEVAVNEFARSEERRVGKEGGSRGRVGVQQGI